MRTAYSKPPTEWASGNVVKASDDLYYRWLADPDRLDIWHWCVRADDWPCLIPTADTVRAKEPTTLEPMLLFGCCGMRGWLRNGRWESA